MRIVVVVFLIFNLQAMSQTYFYPTEKITYVVHYGFINAAEITVETDSVAKKIDSTAVYQIKVVGKTKGAVGLFAHIENTYFSFIDTVTHLPKKFIRDQHENNFKAYEIVEFDHKNLEAISTRRNDNTKMYDIKNYPILPTSQDAVSAYFQIRNANISKLKKNDQIEVNVHFEGKNYPTALRFLERDRIKTKIGKFRAFVFSPVLPNVQSLSKQENPVKIWISDDAKRIPLEIDFATKYGKIKVEVSEYEIRKKAKK